MADINQNNGPCPDGDGVRHVTGYVTVTVPVDFETVHGPDEDGFLDDLTEAVSGFDCDWEIDDISGLDFGVGE